MSMISPFTGLPVQSTMAASIASVQNDINTLRVEIAQMLYDELLKTYERLQDALAEREVLDKRRCAVLGKIETVPEALLRAFQKTQQISSRIKVLQQEMHCCIQSGIKKSFIREDLAKLYSLQKKLMDHTHDYTYPPGHRMPMQEVKVELSKAEFPIGKTYSPNDTIIFYPTELNPADYEV